LHATLTWEWDEESNIGSKQVGDSQWRNQIERGFKEAHSQEKSLIRTFFSCGCSSKMKSLSMQMSIKWPGIIFDDEIEWKPE